MFLALVRVFRFKVKGLGVQGFRVSGWSLSANTLTNKTPELLVLVEGILVILQACWCTPYPKP